MDEADLTRPRERKLFEDVSMVEINDYLLGGEDRGEDLMVQIVVCFRLQCRSDVSSGHLRAKEKLPFDYISTVIWLLDLGDCETTKNLAISFARKYVLSHENHAS